MLINHEIVWPLALSLTILGGFALGSIHGLLVTRLNMQPFVVTLCGLLLYRGIARWYTADSTQGFGYGGGYETLEWVMSGRTYNIPHTFVFLVLVAAIMAVVLHRSVYGRYLFAVGKNEEAARFSGIPTKAVITGAYMIAGTLAGISSVFFVFYTQSVSPSAHGNFYELYAIAAAVLGGCSLRGGEGSIIGIVLGTVLLQVLQNLVNMLGIPSSLNFAVMGAVILLGVLADQQLQRRRQRQLAMASAEARSLAKDGTAGAAI
jgi:ribose transport system permease protein